MKTKEYKLTCGQCGNEKHLVYKRENGEILLECVMCNSVSLITIINPIIVIKNESGLGTIC